MRTFAIFFGAACLFALSGCASQSGVVLHFDDWNRTLRIGDEVYEVTRDTQLYGPEGGPISLHEVPTISDPGIGVRYAGRAEVDFEASERAGRRHLDWLWVHPR